MNNFNSADERERDKLKVLIHKYIFNHLEYTKLYLNVDYLLGKECLIY